MCSFYSINLDSDSGTDVDINSLDKVAQRLAQIF